jgi:cysteine sulfinate desulfinase/cysteine desulfurase-like protein/rhodanese-related sulfurtransferase
MLPTTSSRTGSDSPDIYLDSNATTQVLELALLAAQQAMQANFGNPSSTHSTGLRARALLDSAHKVAQQVLGAGQGRVMFTSGATEAIQTAILSALSSAVDATTPDSASTAGKFLLYGATEHKAVPEALKHWNKVLGLQCEIHAIPVDQHGMHDLAFLASHAANTLLVCTMAVNNETGVISDLAGIRAAIAGSGALWLVDSVQALGKRPLDLATSGIDYAPFSGHKLYAPKGIGMLYVRQGAPFTPLLVGGGQETGQRGGTENLPGIAALGAVLTALHQQDPVFQSHAVQAAMRQRLAESLQQAFPGVVFNAAFDNAVATTLNFSVPGLSSKEMLDLFDASGIRVSSGSACNSNKVVRSFVLDAMGLENWRVTSAIRMSFGPATRPDEIEQACERILRAGSALRNACLLFGGDSARHEAQTPAKGLIRLMHETACSWIYCDQKEQVCVIIDPLPELMERIARWVACRDLQVVAIIATDAHHVACRHALQEKLRERMACQQTDNLGWPNQDVSVLQLQDGTPVAALALGASYLMKLPLPDASEAFYLLGHSDGQRCLAADVRFAFIGDTLPEQHSHLARWLSPHTLLLSAHDQWQQFASTIERESQLAAPVVPGNDDLNLPCSQLQAFLQAHPKATLIDVREGYEHGMGLAGLDLGHEVRAFNAPLSRLPEFIADWLQNPEQELLFVCRSGARSGLAASCLRRLGHQQAWHLVGGLALQ